MFKWKTGFLGLGLLLLVAWPTTGISQTERGSEQSDGPAKIDMDYWRISNECAEAAAKFWKLAGHHDGEENAQYSNHFNRHLGKCLIRLGTMSKDKDGKLVNYDDLYDAVEHVQLISLATIGDTSTKPATVTIIFNIKGKPPTFAKGTIERVADQIKQFTAQMNELMEQ